MNFLQVNGLGRRSVREYAFGTAHRSHASTAVIAKFFPVDKEFGLLLQGEIDALSKVMSEPASPLLAIIGGAKS